ncbi:MAG: hypothetical protein WCD59_00810, partial [Pseudolabrys sp.]
VIRCGVADKAQRRIIDTTASESGNSVGYTARASIVSLDSRDNLASSRFSVVGNNNARPHANKRSSSVG